MSEHYHEVGDMRFLKEMGKLAPTEFKAWLGLDDIVRLEDGAIHSEKISRAHRVGGRFHDPMSLLHRRARKRRESGRRNSRGNHRSSLIAAALRTGGAATHGAMVLKFYDQC